MDTEKRISDLEKSVRKLKTNQQLAGEYEYDENTSWDSRLNKLERRLNKLESKAQPAIFVMPDGRSTDSLSEVQRWLVEGIQDFEDQGVAVTSLRNDLKEAIQRITRLEDEPARVVMQFSVKDKLPPGDYAAEPTESGHKHSEVTSLRIDLDEMIRRVDWVQKSTNRTEQAIVARIQKLEEQEAVKTAGFKYMNPHEVERRIRQYMTSHYSEGSIRGVVQAALGEGSAD